MRKSLHWSREIVILDGNRRNDMEDILSPSQGNNGTTLREKVDLLEENTLLATFTSAIV